MFRACGALIKHVVSVALYILPYVVLQVVVDGSEKEIKEVNKLKPFVSQFSVLYQ